MFAVYFLYSHYSYVYDLAGNGPMGGYRQMPQPPQQQYQPPYHTAPPAVDADEIRRRRVHRFDNVS